MQSFAKINHSRKFSNLQYLSQFQTHSLVQKIQRGQVFFHKSYMMLETLKIRAR